MLSDYFEQLYNYAIQLIGKRLAYVDDSTAEQIAEMKRLLPRLALKVHTDPEA